MVRADDLTRDVIRRDRGVAQPNFVRKCRTKGCNIYMPDPAPDQLYCEEHENAPVAR